MALETEPRALGSTLPLSYTRRPWLSSVLGVWQQLEHGLKLCPKEFPVGSERRTLIKPKSHESLKSKLVGDKKVGGDISRMGKTVKAHASGGHCGISWGPFAGKWSEEESS